MLIYRKKPYKPLVSEQSRIFSEERRKQRVEAEYDQQPERREDLRDRQRRALRRLHKCLEKDQKRYCTEVAEEVEDAGKRAESQAMFAAVGVLKTLDPHQRSSQVDIKNWEGIVVNSTNEKKEVFATYFVELLNPVQALDKEFIFEEVQG